MSSPGFLKEMAVFKAPNTESPDLLSPQEPVSESSESDVTASPHKSFQASGMSISKQVFPSKRINDVVVQEPLPIQTQIAPTPPPSAYLNRSTPASQLDALAKRLEEFEPASAATSTTSPQNQENRVSTPHLNDESVSKPTTTSIASATIIPAISLVPALLGATEPRAEDSPAKSPAPLKADSEAQAAPATTAASGAKKVSAPVEPGSKLPESPLPPTVLPVPLAVTPPIEVLPSKPAERASHSRVSSQDFGKRREEMTETTSNQQDEHLQLEPDVVPSGNVSQDPLAFAVRLTDVPDEKASPRDPLPDNAQPPAVRAVLQEKDSPAPVALTSPSSSVKAPVMSPVVPLSDAAASVPVAIGHAPTSVAHHGSLREHQSNSATPSPAQSVVELPMDHPLKTMSAPRDVRLNIPSDNGSSTEVRIRDTGREVRVSVRTPDKELAHALRGGLDELRHTLAGGSVQAEVWQPQAANTSLPDDSSQHPSDRHGSGSEGHGGQSNHREHFEHDQPRWVQELEDSASDS